MPSSSESYGSQQQRAASYAEDRDTALTDCNAEALLARFYNFTRNEGADFTPDQEESSRFITLLRGRNSLNHRKDKPEEELHDRAMEYAGAREAQDQALIWGLRQAFEKAVEDDDPSWLHGPMGSPANFQDNWQEPFEQRLQDTELSLEISRRLVYVGLIAQDEHLLGNGMMLADDAMLALDEHIRQPDTDWQSHYRLETLGGSTDVTTAVAARIAFVQETTELYGPTTGNAESWEDGATRRLVGDCVAERDLAWAAEQFREGFGGVEGPPSIRDLLDDMGEGLKDANGAFRLAYAENLAQRDSYRLRETLKNLEQAGSWPEDAAQALDQDVHHTYPGTFAEEVVNAMEDAREHIEHTLAEKGERAAELAAMGLRDRLTFNIEDPFTVPVLAYAQASADRAWVLMAQPGWSENPGTRNEAVRAYTLASGARLLPHGVSDATAVARQRAQDQADSPQ